MDQDHPNACDFRCEPQAADERDLRSGSTPQGSAIGMKRDALPASRYASPSSTRERVLQATDKPLHR